MANIPSQLRIETPGPKTHLLHKHWHVLNTAGPPHSHTTHANFLCTSSPHKLLGTHQLQHSQDRESTLNTRAVFQLQEQREEIKAMLPLPWGAQPGSRLQHRQLIFWAGFKIQNCTLRASKNEKTQSPLLSFPTSVLFTAHSDAKPSINL